MTTPPTPAGRYPEPDDSESTGHAAHPAEPERFELPTFETFETPPFESISSGSFETPPAPPPSPEVTGEPQAPAAPEPPPAPETPEPPELVPEAPAASDRRNVVPTSDAWQNTDQDPPQLHAPLGRPLPVPGDQLSTSSAVSTPTAQLPSRRLRESLRVWPIGAIAVVSLVVLVLVVVLLNR